MKYRAWKNSIKYITRRMSMPIPREVTWAKRERQLSGCGLLAFEKRAFLFKDTTTPAMQSMLRRRRTMFEGARVSFSSFNEYAARIRNWYREQGWTEVGSKRLSPWRMFEYFKRLDDAPDTPQPKHRRKKHKDYAAMKQGTPTKRQRGSSKWKYFYD